MAGVVVNSNTTVYARFVAFVTALVQLLVNLNAMTAGTGDAVVEFLNNPQVIAMVNAVGTIIIVSLPSVLGWISRDKELPPGVQIVDVAVKPNAPAAQRKEALLQHAAQEATRKGAVKAATLFVLCGAGLMGLSACQCATQGGAVHMSRAEQQAAGICVYQPAPASASW